MSTHARVRILLALAILDAPALVGCGTPSAKPTDSGASGTDAFVGTDGAPITGRGGGFITYVAGNELLRIEARRGATPISITAALDAMSPGDSDEAHAVSRNGRFITLTTERFDPACAGYGCLAIVKGDLSGFERVLVNDQLVRAKGHAAISNDGNLIVFPNDGGPHAVDLFAIRRVGATWAAPLLLTANSTEQFNESVVLSLDNSTALFDCGPVPYASPGTGICEVGTEGVGFRKVIDPRQNPSGPTGDFVAKSADYMLDGGIVFEADWSGEQLWRLPPGGGTLRRIFESHSNDNSPCSLPGGYIASLWLGRPEGQDSHELTITAPDGSESFVLTPDVDVLDINVMCHE